VILNFVQDLFRSHVAFQLAEFRDFAGVNAQMICDYGYRFYEVGNLVLS